MSSINSSHIRAESTRSGASPLETCSNSSPSDSSSLRILSCSDHPPQRYILDSVASFPLLAAKNHKTGISGTLKSHSNISLEFQQLLTRLKVSGPVALQISAPDPPLLGAGAQFSVFQGTMYYRSSETPGGEAVTEFIPVALKTPHFHIDVGQRLNIADPKAWQQVHDIVLEILALRHPQLYNHPNIVQLIAWGYHSNYHASPLLVFELALGDLGAFIQDRKDISYETRHLLCCDVGAGLDALHENGIIHGDLKPANVLVFEAGEGFVAKLADFGLSVEEIPMSFAAPPGGTPGWQAPEVVEYFRNGTLIPAHELQKTDNYSFGLLIWSVMLLSSAMPPPNGESDRTAASITKAFDSIQGSLPQSLDNVIRAALLSLLQPLAEDRPGLISNLLQDQSHTYGRRAKKRSHHHHNTEELPPKANFEWELPDIGSYHYSNLLAASRTNVSEFPNSLLLAMFLIGTSLWGKHPDQTPHLLDNLIHSAVNNYEPAQALVYRVHRFLGKQIPSDLDKFLVPWLSKATSTGSWIAGVELANLDTVAYEHAIKEFQIKGGYNNFFSPIPQDSYEKLLLDDGNINPTIVINYRGDRLIHCLTISDEDDLLLRLLQHQDLDINVRNKRGETPLYRACMAGMGERVLQLLRCVADPSIPNSDTGITCLHWIFCFPTNQIDNVARELVKRGADVNAKAYKALPFYHFPFNLPAGTPMHWAVTASNLTAIKTLMSLGADPGIRDGSDPYRYSRNVRILTEFGGPDLTPYSIPKEPTMGLSSLDMAAQFRDHAAISCFAECGIDHQLLPAVDEEGYTPFHRLDCGNIERTYSEIAYRTCFFRNSSRALQRESLAKTIQGLLAIGFDINKITTPKEAKGRTPLMLAVEGGELETVNVLLDQSVVNINEANETGETALMTLPDYRGRAEYNNATEIVKVLLSKGANINAKKNGNSAFIYVCLAGYYEAAELLLDHGADVTSRFSGPTSHSHGKNAIAVLLEKSRGHDAVMERILTKHVFPSDQKTEVIENADELGGSLLHYAVTAGSANLVRLLLRNGARVDAKQESSARYEKGVRKTPLDVAREEREASFGRRWNQYMSKQEARAELERFDEVIALLEQAGEHLGS